MPAIILRHARADHQHNKQAQTPADDSPDAAGRGRRIRRQRRWHNRAFDAPARIMSRLRRRQPQDVSSWLQLPSLRACIRFQVPKYPSTQSVLGPWVFEFSKQPLTTLANIVCHLDHKTLQMANNILKHPHAKKVSSKAAQAFVDAKTAAGRAAFPLSELVN